MKTLFFCSCFLLTAIVSYEQNKRALDSLDKVVIAEIITPAENSAKQDGNEIDWISLTKTITQKYSAIQADRAVTKAHIYYYYGKDWAQFSAALVHYTEAYEDKNDAKLMNKNAQYILQHSQNKDDLKSALQWSKHAMDVDPSNSEYKTTYDALQSKIDSQ